MAKDFIHDSVKKALQKEGWKIIAEPFRLSSGNARFKMDLASEKQANTNEKEVVIIEVKSFLKNAVLYPFYNAFGQYLLYRDALKHEGLDYEIFLAVGMDSFKELTKIPFVVRAIKNYDLKFVVVNLIKEKIITWKR
jgi:hypothetical protein